MSHVHRALWWAAHEPGAAAGPDDDAVATATATLDQYAPERGTDRPETQAPPAGERASRAVVQVRLPDLPPERGSADECARLVTRMPLNTVPVEQYARLAAVLREAAANRRLKVVVVSSAVPREGKTLTAVNLALTLGHLYGDRVLLMDADLRHSSVHRLFGMTPGLGLADVLESDAADLPLVEVSDYVTLLPAGIGHGSPAGAFASARMKGLLDDLAGAFDWIVIDTPPVGLLPDAEIIGRHADGFLLVVASGQTPYKLVRRAVDRMDRQRLLGVVLNQADPASIPASEYYSHYIRRSWTPGGGD